MDKAAIREIDDCFFNTIRELAGKEIENDIFRIENFALRRKMVTFIVSGLFMYKCVAVTFHACATIVNKPPRQISIHRVLFPYMYIREPRVGSRLPLY